MLSDAGGMIHKVTDYISGCIGRGYLSVSEKYEVTNSFKTTIIEAYNHLVRVIWHLSWQAYYGITLKSLHKIQSVIASNIDIKKATIKVVAF